MKYNFDAMHKLASKPITYNCFEMDDYKPELIMEAFSEDNIDIHLDSKVHSMIEFLELLRVKYNETNDKEYWKELVRWLPCGWLQTRTVTMNYENLRTICAQRRGHKLTEWGQFIDWVRKLPYADQFIFGEEVAFN